MFQSTHPRGVRQKTEVSIHGSYQRFNPRTRVGCDPRLCRYFCWVSCFNPRTRVGCDMIIGVSLLRSPVFQSTHPRGVRHAKQRYEEDIVGVSIHAPAWGATHHQGRRLRGAQGFNPRTRVGCDRRPAAPVAGQRPVSIHAPAWGATAGGQCRWERWRCFNPRTRVGCDPRPSRIKTGSICFNPRTRVGCDSHAAFGKLIAFVVSIHAPAWGATPDIPAFTSPISRFNPRTRVGCDHVWGDDMPDEGRFQSTHPRGVRPSVRGADTHIHEVSIHAPAWGATLFRFSKRLGCHVSIHAPAWGATAQLRVLSRPLLVSIHAPAWGATPIPVLEKTGITVSIHAPAWGATACWAPTALSRWSFNPRTRVGCDVFSRQRSIRVSNVSIHAPAWGATVSMFYPVDSRD